MKQVVIRSAGEVGYEDAPLPEPGPGEVRIKPSVVGICGSDLHALAGEHPFIPLPCSPGHEVSGVISALGPGVTELELGSRVLLEPNIVCGECEYCRSGRYNLCENLVVVGCQGPGAMAEELVVPASRLHKVPEAMTDAAAALVEPMATAVHALRVARDVPGGRVVVLGAGSIGLLMLLAARAAGASRVVVSEPRPAKRERALRLGASAVFDPGDPALVPKVRNELGGHADVVLDCVSVQASMSQAIAMAEKGGAVIVVGVPAADVNIPLAIVQDREIRLEGSAMYTRVDMQRAIELVGAPGFPLHELVTATLPFDKAPEAFDLAASGDQVKVQLVVNEMGK